MNFLGSSICWIILSTKKDSFASFFSIWCLLFLFSCKIALAVLQYNVENNGKTSNLALFSVLEERPSVFQQGWCFPRVFHRCLCEGEKFPSIPSLLRVFKIISGYWILSNALLVSILKIMWLFFFFPIKWFIILIGFWKLNYTCILGINLIWPWYIILFMCC